MSNVNLMAVGDTCLQTKNDASPFEGVNEVLGHNDILFGNLETALTKKGAEVERAVPLHVLPDKVVHLKNAGFDIVNIANNHVMDMGPEGFNETLEVLSQNKIEFIGGGNETFNEPYRIIENNGIKLGFLGYCQFDSKTGNRQFICSIDEENIIRDVDKIKYICDIIIVSLHWGIENVYYPSPDQIKLARKLIDKGVSLILGHHPSVLQGIENYKHGLIAYSLGNFQFIDDAPPSIVEKTKETIILSVKISKSGIESYQIIPAKINENYVPCILNEVKSAKILEFIDEISLPITGDKINERWWFEKISREHLVTNISCWIFRVRRYGIKHALMGLRWLLSRFQIKCYLGLLRNILRGFG